MGEVKIIRKKRSSPGYRRELPSATKQPKLMGIGRGTRRWVERKGERETQKKPLNHWHKEHLPNHA